jgi:hypothetical protein
VSRSIKDQVEYITWLLEHGGSVHRDKAYADLEACFQRQAAKRPETALLMGALYIAADRMDATGRMHLHITRHFDANCKVFKPEFKCIIHAHDKSFYDAQQQFRTYALKLVKMNAWHSILGIDGLSSRCLVVPTSVFSAGVFVAPPKWTLPSSGYIRTPY